MYLFQKTIYLFDNATVGSATVLQLCGIVIPLARPAEKQARQPAHPFVY